MNGNGANGKAKPLLLKPATDGELVYVAFLDRDQMFVAAYDLKGEPASDYGSEAQLEILKTLARFGARLPGDKDTVQEFRSVLLKMSWHKGLELLKELRGYGFADAAVWEKILKHPRIRDHFRLRTEALKRLFPEVWKASKT